MTRTIRVTADRLNLRAAPSLSDQAVVAVLRKDQLVELLDDPTALESWRHVRTPPLEGFLAARYVAPADGAPPVAPPSAAPSAARTFSVVPDRLNLRRTPDASSPRTVMGILYHGQPVTLLRESSDAWWYVRSQLGGDIVEGYVAARYLRAEAQDLGPFMVVRTRVNFRKRPSVGVSSPVIRVLTPGQRVRKLEDTNDAWSKVRLTEGEAVVEGYVASRYLTELADPAPVVRTSHIPAVHLEPKAELGSDKAWHRIYPLKILTDPIRNDASEAVKAKQLLALVEMLDVEHSARYIPEPAATFCNIYAYDYCYGAGVYLPRVWWNDRALTDMSRGRSVPAELPRTLRELNANALYEWLIEWGDDYGWRRTDDLTELQDAANAGQVAIICGRRANRNLSGHIVAVVPESPGHGASRTGAVVQDPLQSQAGRNNRQFGTGVWWTSGYDGVGYFFTDQTREQVEA